MEDVEALSLGARGEPVRDVQARLAALGYSVEPDDHGSFGAATASAVRAFQERRHLVVDGVVDEDTWQHLVEAGFVLGDRALYLRHPYLRGDDVGALQHRLDLLGFDPGKEDGIFGRRTDRALRDFQRNVGLPEDGIVGPTTLQALRRLRPVGTGPGRAEVREEETVRRPGTSLDGIRVAIDVTLAPEPPADPSEAAPGEAEASSSTRGPQGTPDVALDRDAPSAARYLAGALVAELRRHGAEPLLITSEDRSRTDRVSTPDPRARAASANAQAAQVLVSIQFDGRSAAAAGGVRAFYFGTERWQSVAGRTLAELIVRNVAALVGLRSDGVHARAFPLLRETRMPAVQVEPSRPRGEARWELRDPAFRERLASAVAGAIERFYAGPDLPRTAGRPGDGPRAGTA
jgi:N-acetylmuramoyl-L-alanine amidase